MYFFRVDSNVTVSGGHVMRCISIAQLLMQSGESVSFLIADDNPETTLRMYGIPFLNLHSDWKNLMTDVVQVQEILKKEKGSTLIIDTYQISRQYVESLKPYGRIVYLGSKAEQLGNLDYLINYSADIDYDFYQSNYSNHTKLLLGLSYAPLREEFCEGVHEYKSKIHSILLTTGNTCKNQFVKKITEKLVAILEDYNITINIVIGRMFSDKEEIYSNFGSNPNIILHENVQSMSSLMKQSDLAISANGTTVYELSALGIPTLSFSMVEEQINSAEALSALGAVDYCGRFYQEPDKCIIRIIERISYYLKNNNALVELATKAHRLIDGNGTKRIVDELMS